MCQMQTNNLAAVKWVSSCLTAHQHNIGHSVPWVTKKVTYVAAVKQIHLMWLEKASYNAATTPLNSLLQPGLSSNEYDLVLEVPEPLEPLFSELSDVADAGQLLVEPDRAEPMEKQKAKAHEKSGLSSKQNWTNLGARRVKSGKKNCQQSEYNKYKYLHLTSADCDRNLIDELLSVFAKETNRYVQELLQQPLWPRSRLYKWEDTNAEEMWSSVSDGNK